jgi:hypothetical protein
MQLYEIIKKGTEGKFSSEQRPFNGKRKIWDLTFVTNVTAEVATDRHVTVPKLAQAHGVSTKTIHAILHEDLNL